MPKRIYILILLLITVKFWGFAPVASLFSSVTYTSVIGFGWIALGLVLYKKDFKTLFGKFKYQSIGLWIALALILSAISTILYYGQSPVNAVLAMKEMVFYFFFPLLLLIKPKMSDIKSALILFSLILPVAELVMTFFPDTVFKVSVALTDAALERDYKDYGDFIMVLDGIPYVAMAFIFVISGMKRRFNLKDGVMALVLLAVIFISQSRSTLLPVMLITGYVIFTMRGDDRKTIMTIRLCSAAFIALLIAVTIPIWTGLFEETASQIGNENYVRYRSYAYFLFEAWPNLWCFIFGNGFLSGKTASSDVDYLGEMGIWSSDVGFVGMWTLCGFIPVILITVLCCKSLFGKNKPFVLKAIAFFILAGSPTTSWFLGPYQIVWICLFFYMFAVTDHIRLTRR